MYVPFSILQSEIGRTKHGTCQSVPEEAESYHGLSGTIVNRETLDSRAFLQCNEVERLSTLYNPLGDPDQGVEGMLYLQRKLDATIFCLGEDALAEWLATGFLPSERSWKEYAKLAWRSSPHLAVHLTNRHRLVFVHKPLKTALHLDLGMLTR